MLDAFDIGKSDLNFLNVDPENLETVFGVGSRKIGDLILRLQAFVLALMEKEVIDVDSFDTFQKFVNKTLFGVHIQNNPHIVTFEKFMQRTGKGMLNAEPNAAKRSAYSKTGLGFYSCKAIYDYASNYWEAYASSHFEENLQHINEDFLASLGNLVFALPETKPDPIKVPHKNPAIYIPLSHGELLVDWVLNSLSIQELQSKYFNAIDDKGESVESCINYIRDAFEYKGPWVISAYTGLSLKF